MGIELQISNIHHVFNIGQPNQVHALKDVSLCLNSGELVLFIGCNGSGKTTLLNVIDGRIKQTRGHVVVNDKNIDSLKVYQRARYMYRIFQNTLNSVVQMASIRENMALASIRGKKFKITSKLVKKSDEELFHQIIRKYNKLLSENLDKKIFTLSPGERQAVILSLLDLQREGAPKILLADEPTASLDPGMATKSIDAIKALSESGWLCIVVTHDEKFINSGFSDKIIKFNNGTIEHG